MFLMLYCMVSFSIEFHNELTILIIFSFYFYDVSKIDVKYFLTVLLREHPCITKQAVKGYYYDFTVL